MKQYRQDLHVSAKTTHVVRALIQRSKASNAALNGELGVNVKTFPKWRKRDGVRDAAMAPKEINFTVFCIEEKTLVVAFQRHSLLPLGDCLNALQPTTPHLTRFSLYRCLQQHGISRLPEAEVDKPKKKFKRYPIGYFHVDIAEVRTGEGKIRLFVAIDRASKFGYVELRERAGNLMADQFLRNLIAAMPDKIHTTLTDNDIQFANRKQDTPAFKHIFDRVCRQREINHRLTKVNQPWINGQVERMNRTIKEATVKRCHDKVYSQFETHITDVFAAYNPARRLKALQSLTLFEHICKIWPSASKQFNVDPTH